MTDPTMTLVTPTEVRLRDVLTELVRAASEYANATRGISGDLGARLSDARAVLAEGE